jgi:hypothetical protein
MRGKELRTDQVLCSDASSGQRVREQKAGVTGKSYSLERKVLSTRWHANREPKGNNESESGRCSRGMSTIRQRGKKGSTWEPYHKGKRRTASAGVPRHGRSMACTTVYTHIGLLTSKGLAQRGEWRRRMEEKDVRNEWSQYSARTVTSSASLSLGSPIFAVASAPFESCPLKTHHLSVIPGRSPIISTHCVDEDDSRHHQYQWKP